MSHLSMLGFLFTHYVTVIRKKKENKSLSKIEKERLGIYYFNLTTNTWALIEFVLNTRVL